MRPVLGAPALASIYTMYSTPTINPLECLSFPLHVHLYVSSEGLVVGSTTTQWQPNGPTVLSIGTGTRGLLVQYVNTRRFRIQGFRDSGPISSMYGLRVMAESERWIQCIVLSHWSGALHNHANSQAQEYNSTCTHTIHTSFHMYGDCRVHRTANAIQSVQSCHQAS